MTFAPLNSPSKELANEITNIITEASRYTPRSQQVYIGYNGDKTARKFFEILLMLGFASIGYHSYYLF